MLEDDKVCRHCVYRDKLYPNICKNCSQNVVKFNFTSDYVDLWILAKGLKNKHLIKDIKKPIPKQKEAFKKEGVNLTKCPSCNNISLFFNKTTLKHECLNLKCRNNKNNIFDNVVWGE